MPPGIALARETERRNVMSYDTWYVQSEAPRIRADAILDLLEGLDLFGGRLSRHDLERVALGIAARPELYEDLVEEGEGGQSWLLLFRNPAYEVTLVTWGHDNFSGWHDHGGSSGAFVVTAGVLEERHRATDYVGIESRVFSAGQYRAFGPDHVHDVAGVPGSAAVSINVYSPPLRGLTFYDHTDFGFVAREFIPDDERRASSAAAGASVLLLDDSARWRHRDRRAIS